MSPLFGSYPVRTTAGFDFGASRAATVSWLDASDIRFLDLGGLLSHIGNKAHLCVELNFSVSLGLFLSFPFGTHLGLVILAVSLLKNIFVVELAFLVVGRVKEGFAEVCMFTGQETLGA